MLDYMIGATDHLQPARAKLSEVLGLGGMQFLPRSSHAGCRLPSCWQRGTLHIIFPF